MTDTPEATSDSTDSERPSHQLPRLKIALLAAMLALVMLALSLVGARMLGWWPDDGEPVAEPTSSPTPTEPQSPFAGTPAENFAEGEAGIVLPEAEPVGDFTAEEVADALEQVRRALIAARLDRTMLIDHNPDEFLALLAVDQWTPMEEAVESGEFSTFPTLVSTDAMLVPVAPRVDGEISYDVATVQAGRQLLELSTRFVWVYAIGPRDAENSSPLVVVRDELVWQVRGEPWRDASQGLWLYTVASQAWGIDCELYEDGLVARTADPLGRDTADMSVIFDPKQPVEPDETC